MWDCVDQKLAHKLASYSSTPMIVVIVKQAWYSDEPPSTLQFPVKLINDVFQWEWKSLKDVAQAETRLREVLLAM